MKALTSPATSTVTSVSRVYIYVKLSFSLCSFLTCLSVMFYHCNSSFNDHETTLHALPSETSAFHTEVMVPTA